MVQILADNAFRSDRPDDEHRIVHQIPGLRFDVLAFEVRAHGGKLPSAKRMTRVALGDNRFGVGDNTSHNELDTSGPAVDDLLVHLLDLVVPFKVTTRSEKPEERLWDQSRHESRQVSGDLSFLMHEHQGQPPPSSFVGFDCKSIAQKPPTAPSFGTARV